MLDIMTSKDTIQDFYLEAEIQKKIQGQSEKESLPNKEFIYYHTYNLKYNTQNYRKWS